MSSSNSSKLVVSRCHKDEPAFEFSVNPSKPMFTTAAQFEMKNTDMRMKDATKSSNILSEKKNIVKL